MTTAYLLHCQHFDYLPYQVRCIKEFLPWVKGIVVVQGPFQGGFFDSKTRLSLPGAQALGVILQEFRNPLQGGPFARQRVIIEAILRSTAGTRLILQGDCLPDKQITQEDLLQGHLSAARLLPNGQLAWTWLLTAAPSLSAVLGNCRSYGSRIDDEALHTESCEPCFWHLDKVGHGHLLEEKLDLLRQRFGELPPPLTEPAPQPPTAQPVYDPEALHEPPEAQRRRDICRTCGERPEGCWMKRESQWTRPLENCGKFRAAQRHAVNFGHCPLDKWQPPEPPQLVMGTRKLICMLHAQRHQDRLALCERTWLADAREARQGVVVVRTIEDPTWPTIVTLHGSELWVPVPDRLACLPQQVRAFCQWALTRDDWDYLFKCDDDTFISIPRFLDFDPAGKDYIGDRLRYGGLTYAHGGGGYFLSRKATGILAEHLTQAEGAEDWWVGETLRQHGIGLHHSGQFDGRGRDIPKPQNNRITTHRRWKDWLLAHSLSGLHGPPRLPPETHSQRVARVRRQRNLPAVRR